MHRSFERIFCVLFVVVALSGGRCPERSLLRWFLAAATFWRSVESWKSTHCLCMVGIFSSLKYSAQVYCKKRSLFSVFASDCACLCVFHLRCMWPFFWSCFAQHMPTFNIYQVGIIGTIVLVFCFAIKFEWHQHNVNSDYSRFEFWFSMWRNLLGLLCVCVCVCDCGRRFGSYRIFIAATLSLFAQFFSYFLLVSFFLSQFFIERYGIPHCSLNELPQFLFS